jgi:hypothetical protein
MRNLEGVLCLAFFSNHQPLLFSQELSSRTFKFFKVCLKFGPNLLWDAPCLVCLQQNLKRLKHALKEWNKSIYGNVHTNVYIAIDEIYRIQLFIE